MPVSVNVPTRIRVDPGVLFERQGDIEEALAVAVERALTSSRQVVLAKRGGYLGVRLNRPHVTWTGDAAGSISGTYREEFEAKLATLLAETAADARLFDFANSSSSAPITDEAGEKFDITRADYFMQTYETPTYQPGVNRRSSSLQIRPGSEQDFWNMLQDMLLKGTGGSEEDIIRRAGGIQMLVSLIDHPEARDILRQGIVNAGERPFIRWEVIETLYQRADTQEQVWDLILLGVGFENESLAQHKFFLWLRHGGGREVVAFLDRKLNGTDAILSQKAAKVILYLLEFQYKPEGRDLATNLGRIRRLASYHISSGSVLRFESLRQITRSRIHILKDFLPTLEIVVRAGPEPDPHVADDKAAIYRFQEALENKEKSLDELDLMALENLDIRLSQAIYEGLNTRNRIASLHESGFLLQSFLEQTRVQSDEITALFGLRHKYIQVFSKALDDPDFRTSMSDLDTKFTYFDVEVAETKWRRVRREFSEVRQALINAKNIQPGGGLVEDLMFVAIRDALDKACESLTESFIHKGGHIGSLRVPQAEALPSDLNRAIDVETDVALLGIDVAMFTLYALALRLHNEMIQYSIGSGNFREEQGGILSRVRAEIAGYHSHGRYREFISDRIQIERSIQQVGMAIKQRARLDLAIDLIITAAASLLSFGVAAIARGAMIGRTLVLVRSAQAARAVVFLAEVGTFTAAQLAGERLFFGRPVELGGAAERLLGNAAMFGAFRMLGRLTSGLARGRTLLGFVIPHVANLAAMTAVSALMTLLETGHWPPSIGEFLFLSIAHYVLIAGIGEAARSISRPHIEARVRSYVESMDRENASLYERFGRAVRNGRLTEEEFEAIRQKTLELNGHARELARFLKGEGIIASEHSAAIEEHLALRDSFIRGVQFPRPQLPKSGSVRMLHAVSAPSSVTGLIRLGNSQIYRYDPLQQPPDLPNLLEAYESAGYYVRTLPGGVISVTDASGALLFVIEPGSIVPTPLPLLPASLPGSAQPRPLTFIERAIGLLTEANLNQIISDLSRINRILVQTLEAEYDPQRGHHALVALRLIIEQIAKLRSFWPIDSVRGLAEMLRLERGITLATVRRLFHYLTSEQLSDLFLKYKEIADRPGANFLVDDELLPSRTVQLINAYDAFRRARLDMPADMSRKAVRGVLRLVRESPADFVVKLKDIPLDRRLSRLEAISPIVDPRVQPISRIQEVLRRHSQDIRPGLNLLRGTASEVVAEIERLGQSHGSRFIESQVRNEFQSMVERYRGLLADLQAGTNVERNVEGLRNEIDSVILAFESSGEIFAVGNIGRNRIDPGFYELPRHYRIINAPKEVEFQLDVGKRQISGRLQVSETTTGELGLPEFLRGLDPASGLPEGGTIDYHNFDQDNPVHRKWWQIIKLSAAARFATELGRAWGHADTEMPELVVRVSRISPAARRAVEQFGFRVEITGGLMSEQ